MDVRIREFHGDLDGEVRVIATFTLTGVENGERLAKKQVSFEERQPTGGYSALVKTQISLLDRLARSIVEALREAGVPTIPAISTTAGSIVRQAAPHGRVMRKSSLMAVYHALFGGK